MVHINNLHTATQELGVAAGGRSWPHPQPGAAASQPKAQQYPSLISDITPAGSVETLCVWGLSRTSLLVLVDFAVPVVLENMMEVIRKRGGK